MYAGLWGYSTKNRSTAPGATIQLCALFASLRVESAALFELVMSGYTDRSDLIEDGLQNGSTEIEHETEDEHPTHTIRLFSQAAEHGFPATVRLSNAEIRRLDDGVESPTIRRWLNLNADAVARSHSLSANASERGLRGTVGSQRVRELESESDSELEVELESEGVYGWYDSQPIVASRSDEWRAEMNARGRPADALSESDVLARGQYIYMGHDRLTDPTGDQLTGTASGFDEYDPVSSTDVPVRLGRQLVPEDQLDAHTRRLRALKIIPEDEQTPREAEGVRTDDLEVTLPSGELVALRTLVANPAEYSRSSIPGIERRLALDAELKNVSAGIDAAGHLTGLAATLDAHTDWLARYRSACVRVAPERREQTVSQQIYDLAEPLRELEAEDPELRDEVLTEARRVLSAETVHEIRRRPVAIASDLAQRVLTGQDVTSAFLKLLQDEETNPRNVLRINAILRANLRSSKGYLTTQGVVKKVYYADVPGLKFGMIVKDGDRREDEVRVSVWESSEEEITASTADPDDADGEVIISKKILAEPNEGDVVRLVDFKLPYKRSNQTYQGQPKLDSRWESEIQILERAPITASTRSTPATPQRVGQSSRSSDAGEAVPRSHAAKFSGDVSTTWPAPALLETLINEELARVSERVHAIAERQQLAQQENRMKRNRRFLREHPEALTFFKANALMRFVNGDSPRNPSSCWVCGVRNDDMNYDPVVASRFHALCLARAGVESCKEYTEQRLTEYTESLDAGAA
ncbi:hypothetical protein [Haloplanus halophilus]|uniref:hypothetical protein n=1 Tax=Haloplanus halophilus TaxID=2949993 RepID=UPI0020401E30|nr:hypothetical protein [Haloplanus sp. GDY1]